MPISNAGLLPLLPLLLLPLLSHGIPQSGASLQRQKRFFTDVVKDEVCYDTIGCFSNGGNFHNDKIRPAMPLPWSPEQVDPTFALYTRSNILEAQVIKDTDKSSVTSSHYDAKKPTRIIVHGWIENGNKPWVVEMKKALLRREDCNVVQLDWSKANGIVYEQSTANTRVVGALIARFVLWLEREFSANREQFHIIGHSLGSHIAGYAGARLRSDSRMLGRITGLDPAGPYFEFMHPEARLDPTDARFVDAIHTDGSDTTDEHLYLSLAFDAGIGLMQPVGHVDFYPNGGVQQPGCTKNIFVRDILAEGVIEAGKWTLAACDHMRATILFTATVANPTADFRAYECDNYKEFQAGRCLKCGDGSQCAELGIRAIEWKPAGRINVKMWSDTQPTEPFYKHHYSVKVQLDSSSSQAKGDVKVTLISSDSHTTEELELVKDQSLQAGQTVQALVSSAKNVVGVAKLRVGWKSTSWFDLFSKPSIALQGGAVFEGITQKESSFCGHGVKIETETSTTLSGC